MIAHQALELVPDRPGAVELIGAVGVPSAGVAQLTQMSNRQVEALLRSHQVSGVIHFAGSIVVIAAGAYWFVERVFYA